MRRVEIVRMLMRVRKWVGRGKGYSLSITANDDTCGELYFPKLIPKYCIPVFLRTLTLLFAPSEPKSFKWLLASVTASNPAKLMRSIESDG